MCKGAFSLLVSLLFIFSHLVAQKFDNIWRMGYNWDGTTIYEVQGFELNFDTFPPRFYENQSRYRFLDGYASICDSAGQLQYLTNGCFLIGADEYTIPGGDTITMGWELDWCQLYWRYPFEMHHLFLPAPGHKDSMYLFQVSAYNSTSGPFISYDYKLNYFLIDTKANDGLGSVVEGFKNVMTDTFSYGELTAIKHGNGRDWWIPMVHRFGNKISMVLMDKDSLYVHHQQKMGPAWGQSGAFQTAFSADGSMLARYNHFYGLYLYDFDRCSGNLSNLRYFPFIDNSDPGLLGGVAFSPDNHYLYFPINYDSLFQMDLEAPDLAASVQLVATWDGHASDGFFPTKFAYIIPAPDGRLYVLPPATTKSMHVINRPNLGGEACDMQQHVFDFPYYYRSPPNFPNYRLGPLDGSPCDTLGLDNLPLANFRPDPSDTSGLALQFWDVSAYAPSTWHWDFGDGSTSQDTSPAHTYAAPGFYTVCQTVSNAYGSDSHCKIVHIQTVGTTDAGSDEVLEIYPNPSTGLVYLPWRDAPAGRVRVHDLTGRLVQDMEVQGPEINLGALPDGLYVLTVQERETGRRWVGKVLVLK